MYFKAQIHPLQVHGILGAGFCYLAACHCFMILASQAMEGQRSQAATAGMCQAKTPSRALTPQIAQPPAGSRPPPSQHASFDLAQTAGLVSPETRAAWTKEASIGAWWRRVEAVSARPFLPVHDTLAAVAFVAQARGDDLSQSAQSAPFQRLVAWDAWVAPRSSALRVMLRAIAVPEEGHCFPAAIQEGLLTLLLGHNDIDAFRLAVALRAKLSSLPCKLDAKGPHGGSHLSSQFDVV